MKPLLIALLFLSPVFLQAQSQDAAILEYARASIRENGMEESLKQLELLMAEREDFRPACLLGQALCYSKLEQLDQAKAHLDEVFATEQTNSALVNCDSYWLRGNIHEREGEPAEEIAAFKKALSYIPDHPEIRSTLALALINSDKNEEGVSILEGMISEGYEHSFIFNNMAAGLLNLDQLKEAKAALDKAQELDEENPFVYYNYYQYFKKKGDLTQACENLSTALSLDVLVYGIPADLEKWEGLQKKECSKQ